MKCFQLAAVILSIVSVSRCHLCPIGAFTLIDGTRSARLSEAQEADRGDPVLGQQWKQSTAKKCSACTRKDNAAERERARSRVTRATWIEWTNKMEKSRAMREQSERMSSASCRRMCWAQAQCALKQPEWGGETKDIPRAKRTGTVSSGLRTTDRLRRNCQQVTRQLGSQVAAACRPQWPLTLTRSDARAVVWSRTSSWPWNRVKAWREPLRKNTAYGTRDAGKRWRTRTNSFAQQPWRSARRIAPSAKDCAQ